MRLNSWLLNLYRRLSRPSVRTSNRRQRTRHLASATIVESLEQRRLLAGAPLVPSQTWANITNTMPNFDGAQIALELPNGKLMIHGTIGNGGGESANWYTLTPDSTGGYQNGTWQQIASMNVQRLYFGSVVLPNGNVFVVGGEYASDNAFSNSAEIYNPVTNKWTMVASSPLAQVGDEPTELLPDGNVLVGDIASNGTEIYNPTTNTWSPGGAKIRFNEVSDEEAWVKLPNGDVLAYDIFASEANAKGEAELYNPTTNRWSDASAGNLPVLTDSTFGEELGPALMLPDGRAMFNGANGLTAFYDTNTNRWSQGPTMPSVMIGGTATQLTSGDASGAILPNGDVLLSLSPRVTEPATGPNFPGPTFIYDFNPTTGVYTDVTPPSSVDGQLSSNTTNSFITTMLVLPTGQVMMDDFTGNPDLYTPNGAPAAAWLPQITGLTNNGNGTYTLTGTQLNGLDEGAAYGDDNNMAENYPIVQVTDVVTGNVFYATTSNWSLLGKVATGNTPETVTVTMPAALGNDHFTLVVIANGISSAVDNVFAPSDIQLSPSSVVEHSPVGTVVGSFSTTENGTGNTFTYSLVAGAGSTDNGSFNINANGQLTTNAIFDFNTKNSYSIRVQTTDQNNDTFQKVLTVTITQRQPVTLTVTTLSDTHQAGQTTLREAIATANLDYVGDTITFAPGLIGTISLTGGELAITAPMTITGPGAALISVSGNKNSRIFDVDDTNPANPPTSKAVTITGLTLTNGNGTGANNTGTGGAVFNAAQLTLAYDVIKGNSGTTGGGLENTGNASLYSDTFSGNSATLNGGGLDNSGTLTATNTTIFGNTANIGGGVSNTGTLTTTNVTIAGNAATTSGGGFHNATGTWNTIDTIIAGNTVPGVPAPTHSDAENLGGIVTALNTLVGDAATSAGITDGVNGNLVGRTNAQIFATDINGNPVLGFNGGSIPTVAVAKGSAANNDGAPLTTLASAAAAGATTLAVKDATFIAVGDLLRIDSEIFLVTAINSNNLSVVGAQNSTSPAIHLSNATILLAFDETGAPRANLDLGALRGTENHAPSGQNNRITILEDHSYTFKAADFGFVDLLDNPPNSLLAVKMTTLPAHGTLFDNNVPVVKGQFVSAADINANLLVFTPLPDANGTGYGTFTFQVQDNGGTLGGGFDTDPTPKTMAIDVTGVNDAPVGTSATVTILENTAYTFNVSDFGFTDPHDHPPNNLLAVRMTTIPSNGTLTDNNIPVAPGQFVSVADILNGNLVFTPITNQSGIPYDSFLFQVQDDGGTANSGVDIDTTPKTLSINVTQINAAPVGTSGTVSAFENTVYTIKTSDFGFTDPNNNPPNNFLAVKIAILPDPTVGILQDNNVPVAAGQFVSVADISAGLFTFTPQTGLTGLFFMGKYQVQDDGGTAGGGHDLDPNGSVLDAQIAVVNHAPMGTSGTVATAEGTPYTLKIADFGFSDPNDTPPNTLLAVKVALVPDADVGTLTDNGVAVTPGQFISVADISAGNLVFTPQAGLIGLYFMGKYQVQDNGGTANGGHDLDPVGSVLDVQIQKVNHAPVGTSGTINAFQDTTYIFKSADFGFTDPNDNPPNQLLAVKIALVPDADVGKITDSGIPVTVGQFVSVTDINSGNLTFTPQPGLFGGPYFMGKYQVQDNGGTSNGGHDLDPVGSVLDVFLTRINHAPVGTSGTVTAFEGTPYTFHTTDFGFTDPNDNPPNTLLAVKVATLPDAGVGIITDNNIPVTAGQFVSVTDISAGKLVFTPQSGLTGLYFMGKYQVEDNGGTANGGQNLDPVGSVLDVQLISVNHAPVGTSGTVNSFQNATYTFQTSDFGFSDPNDNPPNNLLAVKVAILPDPGVGVLKDNGVAVTVGQFVSAADISAGNMTFTPHAGLTGLYFMGKYQVQDDGGTANGGHDLDPVGSVLDVQLARVNHAPVGTSGTFTAVVNTPYAFKTSDFGFTDPNDNPPNTLLAVKITLLPSPGTGTLSDNGIPVTLNQSVSAADISAGHFTFTPAAGVLGGPFFVAKFQVQDNGGTAGGGVDLDPNAKVLDVKIVNINHAPVGKNGTVTTTKNKAYVFHAADFGFSDPNDNPPNAFLAVKIDVLPTTGTLTDKGVAVTAGQLISVADINAGKLVFTPQKNIIGTYFAMKFQVEDNGGTANGGTNLDPDPKVLNIFIKG